VLTNEVTARGGLGWRLEGVKFPNQERALFTSDASSVGLKKILIFKDNPDSEAPDIQTSIKIRYL
jgi:hypothetical protein